MTFTGVDIHPGTAIGKMVNALRPATRFVAALPADGLSPETTSGREGFIHPFELTGTAREAVVRLIVRDFDDGQLAAHLALLERTAAEVIAEVPGATLHIETQRQYSNMRTFIERDTRVTAAAVEAMRQEGIEPIRAAIRGGTDGSVLSETRPADPQHLRWGLRVPFGPRVGIRSGSRRIRRDARASRRCLGEAGRLGP